MLRYTCLFIWLLSFRVCFAGTDTTARHATMLRNDTSVVKVRALDQGALKAYKKLPEFNYQDDYDGPSAWSRFWKWFWSLFEIRDKTKAKTFAGWFAAFIKYFFIVGGIAALIFLVLKLAGINLLNVFRRKSLAALAYTETEENIHEIDFNADIDKAISLHNYRLAVRLLYLKTLKHLSDTGRINWQINKTNTHYINELTNAGQREAFKQLTRQFEYVWYGDFVINQQGYQNISNAFNSFNKGKA